MRPLILTLIALLALACLPACDPSTFFLLAPQIIDGGGASGQPFEQPRNVDALRAEMIGLINDARETKDLIPLAPSTALHSVAQQHSNDMVAKNFLGHNGSDGSTPESRVKRSIGEAKYLGENVGAGFRTITIAHSKFMASPDNRKNIMAADATQIGIGIAFGDEENKYKDGIYLTILFFTPK
ncbi:MAG: hypothetical protein GEEBNDBF_01866 [bacterium]|nr:hypothetical protein [bacterium]